jgi:two-component system response regulator NreC
MAAHLHLAPALAEIDESRSPAPPIRVVLAEDHALMRHSLRVLLDGEEDVDVIAEAQDIASAVRHVHGHKPHVLVVDVRMLAGSTIETIGALRERAPDTGVIVLSMNDSPAFAQHALASGALGFVLKQFADSELPQAVRCAARGEEYISAHVAARL